MGTVHKFKRPPKNRKQFEGYSPRPRPTASPQRKHPRLSAWQAGALAWLMLILVAVGIWAVGAFL